MQLTNPKVTENYENGTYTFAQVCTSGCGHTTEATVKGPDLFRYRQGAHPQQAFPYLTAEQREAVFMTGICAICWDNMFPDEDDEEVYDDFPYDHLRY